MTDIERLRVAVANLRSANFAMGPAWEAAHELAQAHEGEAMFDRLHALLHRIEGDDGNAAYWYRRAGVPVVSGAFAAEAASLILDLSRFGR